MSLPENLHYSHKISLQKLRPGADVEIDNWLVWKYEDPQNRPQPTVEEIQTQFEADKLAAEEWFKNNPTAPF